MKVVGCLLRFLLFLVMVPVVLAMPPLALFVFAWMAWTAYFLRKEQ